MTASAQVRAPLCEPAFNFDPVDCMKYKELLPRSALKLPADLQFQLSCGRNE